MASLATECGLPAPVTPDGPGAAEAVRAAVAEVLETAGEAVSVGVPMAAEAVTVAGPRAVVPAARPGGAGAEAGADSGPGTVSALGEAGPAVRASGVDPGRDSASMPATAARQGHVGCGASQQPESGGAPPLAPPGELPAARFLRILADRVAVGAASVVAVLDPGCVVLGGEVGQAGGAVLAGLVEERLRRMSPRVTEVRASSLGGTAVLRGALLTARERAQDELFAPPERPGG